MARDVDGVGCSSSSSASTKRWKYDVFLSFRGEDTRKNFTDHLYVALKRKGLRTFRDEEELERGEYINPGLVQAIDESRSAIVVLSPNYASSTWCLDELQKILQLKEESSLQVFPIFYRVDPSSVRKQKGCFAEAFIKHEERFVQDKMKVRKSRDALEKIATICGWHLQNWHEMEFTESIAEEIMSKLLDDELPSDLGMLIGIQPKLDELESIVTMELGGVGFIGIWGIGDIGKTTLARAFYERKLKNFEIHCFLHNIREAYEKEGDKPNEDYLNLARTVIEYARGLPLALKVLGSFLCKRTIVQWKHAPAKFKKVPPNDILKILQVSFDGLDITQKTIFLDIACFFNGMVQDHVIQILEILDNDLHPKIGINVLIEQSLVINYEGHLWVREILQNMGKYIVYEKSPDDAGKRSRLLSLEDAKHGTEAIRGIILTLEKSCDTFWDPEAFSKMSNLKLLIISNCSHVLRFQLNLPYGLKALSKELKSDNMGGSLQSLKSIDLSYSEYLSKTPNFDGIPHLEKLILEGCSNLIEIHRSLGQHKKLVIVNLKDCREVKNLPRKFEMNCLETFVLSGCSRVIKLPEFGKDMERLSKLDLEGTAITKCLNHWAI
ncbi:TMV resistance protein N-like [Neltuma alba]|uniref:TMV resistance protein N-like n=1 Tax=Neltuma alba TaxID=207710 RepID=UPI0010A55558|nr:TMV resistance protein N-like [Prosopis alba]